MRCGDLEKGFRYSDISLPIPYPIQSYFTKMMDSLDQFSLLTLKTASVIAVGQHYLSKTFGYRVLRKIHPLRELSNTGRLTSGYIKDLHTSLTRLICTNR